MRALLESWPEVAERLRAAGEVALFLDFDGTLARLTARPQDAVLDRATRAALLRLARNPHVRVCVISGRRKADLEARVSVPGLRYLGMHGWETGPADAAQSGSQQDLMRRVDTARAQVAEKLNGANVRLENKGMSFALHYRGARSAESHGARALLNEVLASSAGGLRAIAGDRVWEVLPREVRGKGYAARKQWLRDAPSALPVYAGNDRTDEQAFHALASGITVRVGPARSTRAQYLLRNTGEVRRFLEKLEEEVRCPMRRDSNL